MTWQLFEAAFPDGTNTEEYGFITANTLRNSPEITAVTVKIIKMARNMCIRVESHIYGAQNEYALGVDYDVNNETPHPDIITPLNVYGASMLNDYIYLHPEFKKYITE